MFSAETISKGKHYKEQRRRLSIPAAEHNPTPNSNNPLSFSKFELDLDAIVPKNRDSPDKVAYNKRIKD